MQTTSHITRILVLSILIGSAFLEFIPAPVFASGPTEVKNKTGECTSGASCATGNFASSVTSGNMMIVDIAAAWTSNDCTPTYTLSDTRGTTFTLAVQGPCIQHSTLAEQALIYYGTLGSSGTESVTVTPSKTINFAVTVMAHEVSGVAYLEKTASGSCTFSCTGETTVQASSSVSFAVQDYLNAVVYMNVASSSPGATYSAVCTTSCGTKSRQSEYSTTGASPNNFPWSVTVGSNDGKYTLAGAAFSLANPNGAGTIVIGPCNFFQLQCWWYPLLFMGLYSGFMLMVAQILKIPSKAKAHIFISAMTYGSLIAVILGIMNIVFPVLMLAVNTVIVLRSRG